MGLGQLVFTYIAVALLAPIILLVVIIRLDRQTRRLSHRLRSLERDVAELRQLAATRPTSGLGQPSAAEEPARALGPASRQPEPAAEAEGEPAQPAPEGEIPAGRPPPPPRFPVSLEEQLGARLPVWLGSIALALAGVFLFRWTIERGLLNETVRVGLGVVLGVGLLAAGEVASRSWQRVAGGLSAAGIAVLYASFVAGTSLYEVIVPAAGFGLMSLTTATAVGLSLRQGKIVATVGLVGGLLTPYLVRTRVEPDVRGLFVYLLVLQLGILVVTRRRGWWPLAGLALVGGGLWVLGWVLGPFQPGDARWLYAYLLAATAAFAFAASHGPAAKDWADRRVPWALTWAAVAMGLGLMAMVVSVAGFRPIDWAFIAVLTGGSLYLGHLTAEQEGLPWLAALLVAILLNNWAMTAEPATREFLVTVFALGALISLGAYALMWEAPRPLPWAALSGGTAVVYLLIAYRAPLLEGRSLPWGATALALAATFLGLAVPVARRRQISGAEEALAALAAAVTALVSLAVPFELERQWLAVAWSLEVAALLWIARRIRLPALRGLAWLLAGIVGLRLFLNPGVLSYPIGDRPVVNWLLYGYGVPLAAFAAGAYLSHQEDRRLSQALQYGALASGFYLVTLQIRQSFHPGNLVAGATNLAELGTYAVAWLLGGVALLRACEYRALDSLNRAGLTLVALGTAWALVVVGLFENPLWTHHAVGSRRVVNLLPYVYGLPALLLLASAWLLARRQMPRPVVPGLASAALVLVFLLVTLEVRQAFQGTYLDIGVAGTAERYAYSLAWVLLGTLLLLVGVTARSQLARYASLAVMFLAVAKVFLYDVGALTNLYRVFSFLGLGLSLLLLAYLYQRFVFTESRS